MFVPYQLQIEVTNVCNLNCVGCMRESDKEPKSHMSPELFYHILDMENGIHPERYSVL